MHEHVWHTEVVTIDAQNILRDLGRRECMQPFIGYPYAMLAPLKHMDGIAVADPLDIACMKISAIASRGTKRDFVDLYWIAKNEDLRSLLDQSGFRFAATKRQV